MMQDGGMAEESLSEHCSLLAKPGGPPKPKELPADCPKDAAYIRGADVNGGAHIFKSTSNPLIFEGGKGDDKVTIVGNKDNVLVKGGEGNDSLTVQDTTTWMVQRLSPEGVLLLIALAIVFAAIAAIVWKAMPRPSELD